MKVINQELRKKISMYIKNGKDISPLIEGYSLKGENLSGSIIKTFNRVSQDMSGANFARAIIGEPDKVSDISSANISNCNFYRAKFIGIVQANRVIATNTNFNRCSIPYAEYQYADFTGSSFCGCTMCIDGGGGKGAKFSQSVIDELIKGWVIQ